MGIKNHKVVCPICGKKFMSEQWNAKYCSDPCRTKAIRRCQIAYKKEWYQKNRKRSPLREKTCSICGNKYIGHFNSKYCVPCLKEGNWKLKVYLNNRVGDFDESL